MALKPVDYNATVTEVELLTKTLGIFRVVPDEPVGGFIPGQYVVLGLNHDDKGAVMRAYSIASPPHTHPDYYEFYVRFVDAPTSDNPLTHILFNVKKHDRIHFRPKFKGKFTVADTVGEEDKRLKVLIAAGTGVAPFTSMVFEHQHLHGTPGNFAILHGASYPTDLGYKDELEKVMNVNGKVRYLPTVSRPKEADDWSGLTGRAETHFQPGRIELLEKELGMAEGELNPENCTIMICGLQGTIANATAGLLYRGFVPEDRKLRRAFGIPDDMAPSLFWEQYDTTPVIDIKDEALVASLADRLRGAGVELATA